MNVAIVYGTRPEAIKLAPLISSLKDEGVQVTVINSGQHDSLMPDVMSLFSVEDNYDLKALRPRQQLGDLFGRLVKDLTLTYGSAHPNMVVVQGDTMTATAGALTAFYLGIPVAHVEAGLRTYRLDSPFPEEANRRVIGSIAKWNFAPSEQARRNLISEHAPGDIFMTGNTVVDALHIISSKVEGARCSEPKRVVATIHRRENFPYLEGIFRGLARVAESGAEVILPVHANPVVQKAARRWLSASSVQMIEPMDYLPWVGLLKTAHLIITDSGGLQEEAPVLGIPLLIVRQDTERPEVVDEGYGYLVGVREDDIFAMAMGALSGTMPFRQGSPYGDGTASRQIVAILTQDAGSDAYKTPQASGGM